MILENKELIAIKAGSIRIVKLFYDSLGRPFYKIVIKLIKKII